MSRAGINWYDNDSGSGNWFMDLETGTVELTIDVNVIEPYNEHSENRGIGQLHDGGEECPEHLERTDLQLPAH